MNLIDRRNLKTALKMAFARPARRTTAAAAAGALLLSSLITPAWAASAAGYSDVRGEECEEAVAFLTEREILSGYEDGTFRPDGEITRAEIAKMTAALLINEEVSVILPESVLERIPEDSEDGGDDGEDAAKGSVTESGQNGSSEDGKDGKDGRDDKTDAASSGTNTDSQNSQESQEEPEEEKSEIQKLSEQLSADLADESRMRETAQSLYSDLGGSVWAQPYIAVASICGIVNGYGNQTFRPQGNITYNELAAMCVRAAGVDESEISGSWPDNYVDAAGKLGMYKGMKDFDPEKDDGSAPATRGNTAVAVFNVFEEIQAKAQAGYHVPDEAVTALFPIPKVELSLEEAVEKMQTTGTQAENAQLSKRSDEAIAAGYKDTASSIADTLDVMSFLPLEQQYQLQQSGVTKYNLQLTQLQRDFVKENIDNNYEADMNKIEQTTIQLYYGLLQAEANIEVCEETLASEKKTLELIKTKHDLGAASAIEVKSQENNVATAEANLVQAKNTAESTRANFILLMGLDADTEIELTTELEKTALEIPSLSDGLSYMLKNNLELKYYDYLTEVTHIQFQSLQYTTNHSSTTYKKAELAYEQAQMAISQMTESKETNLRTAYEELGTLESQISKYESLISLTEDSLELAKVRYEVGMGTMSDIESAQLTLTQSKQALMSAVVSYNQAVSDILFEIGVGTTRITFS